eukprot:TRINITY_DN966_c0_g1_i1.p1 TRINITY_DN966_c0_g1~~TRINITY_DN966_c0_g1_i1.p1  ORF type:complete len:212 (+),score=49.98 TRINITY_DN966_c0_g1_i1:22-657(+)
MALPTLPSVSFNCRIPQFSAFPTAKLCSQRHSSFSTSKCSGRNENNAFVQVKAFSAAQLKSFACGLCVTWALTSTLPTFAAPSNKRLPPLSKEPNRCEKAFVGNTIGQANGVYDKPLDLRFCDFTNEKNNLKGKSLAAALMSEAKFDGADMSEVIMSKAYAVGASFKGSTFDDANLEGATFEDTIIGYIDLQKLCRNQSLSDEGRAALGCR